MITLTAEQAQQIEEALYYARQNNSSPTMLHNALYTIHEARTQQAECPHGVDDGACKECYMEQAEQEPIGYWKGEFSQYGSAVLYEVPQVSAFGYRYPNHPVYAAPVKRFTSDDVKVAFENGYAAGVSVSGIAKDAEPEPVSQTQQIALKSCIYFDSIDFNQTPPYLRYDTGDRTPKENWTVYCDIQEDLREAGYELTDSSVDHDTVCGDVTPIAAPVRRTKDLTVLELDAIIEKHYDDEMDLKAMILDGIAADREKNRG